MAYITKAVASCLDCASAFVLIALSLACAKTGNRIAAKIAMIAITTRSSMRVNARRIAHITTDLDLKDFLLSFDEFKNSLLAEFEQFS